MQKYLPYLGLVVVLVVAVLITSNLPVANVGLNRSQADSETDLCCRLNTNFTQGNARDQLCGSLSGTAKTSCENQYDSCQWKFMANPRLCEAPTPTPTSATVVGGGNQLDNNANAQAIEITGLTLPAYVVEGQSYTATFTTQPSLVDYVNQVNAENSKRPLAARVPAPQLSIRFVFQGGPGGASGCARNTSGVKIDPNCSDRATGQETYSQATNSATYTAPRAVNRTAGDTYMVYGAQVYNGTTPISLVRNFSTPMGVRPAGYQEPGSGIGKVCTSNSDCAMPAECIRQSDAILRCAIRNSTPTPIATIAAMAIGTMSGKVVDQNGNSVAGVNLYDNDHVLVKHAGGAPQCSGNTLLQGSLEGTNIQRTNLSPTGSGESGIVFLVSGRGFCGDKLSVSLQIGSKASIPTDGKGKDPQWNEYAYYPLHVITPTQGFIVIGQGFIDDAIGVGQAIIDDWPRLSDFIGISDGTLNGEAVQTDLKFSGGTSESIESQSGNGTYKIGTTDSSGAVVFDSSYLDLLNKISPVYTTPNSTGFPVPHNKELTNGGRTVNYVTAIPSGLSVRYENAGTKTTKAVAFSSNTYNLSATLGISGTPVPSSSTPKITSFAPLAAKVGDTVTVKGANFNSSGKALIAGRTINATSGTTATSFKFVVPAGLGVGAYKLQISTDGAVSDFSPKLLSVISSSNSPIIYLTSPAKLKLGRSYNVTAYGINLGAIANLTTSARGISIPSDSLVDLSTLDSFKARFRIVVGSTALDGPNYLTLTDDNDQTITFPVIIAR